MVFQLLPARRRRAEQRASRQNEVLALVVHVFVDQEIFLFGPHRGGNFAAADAEQFQKPFCLRVERGHGFEKRRLFIERLPRIGDKDGGNVERSLLDKGGRSGIPRSISARRARHARSARRKAGGVRFTHDQVFARELHDDLIARRLNKAVMFGSGQIGERLEPVRVVRGPLGDRPILHRIRDRARNGRIERLPFIDRLAQGLVDLSRQ